MADVFIFIMLLILLAFLGFIGYRNRAVFKRYLKDPDYGKEWKPSRKTILSRRIEDANAEIDYIDEQEEKQKGGD